MKFSEQLPKFVVASVLLVGLGLLAYRFTGPGGKGVTVAVKVPPLSALAEKGRTVFDSNCAQCHGANASGTDKGPPLIHDIYNPGHHGDGSFFAAVRNGVRQHHWPYGNMPRQPGITDEQVAAVIKFVRELQVANGITSRPH